MRTIPAPFETIHAMVGPLHRWTFLLRPCACPGREGAGSLKIT
jgi:hypothetical protein